ncbi:MAG: DUF1552 domain-containing protein [Gammaproteobacteria bacterium]|nr:DUF1552 domain-containing protein [Gammaproteobacteria bacterium]
MQQTPARAVPRLRVVYVPNGVRMDLWTPETEGIDCDVTPILEPLKPFRGFRQVLSGMRGLNAEGPHGRTQARI